MYRAYRIVGNHVGDIILNLLQILDSLLVIFLLGYPILPKYKLHFHFLFYRLKNDTWFSYWESDKTSNNNEAEEQHDNGFAD